MQLSSAVRADEDESVAPRVVTGWPDVRLTRRSLLRAAGLGAGSALVHGGPATAAGRVPVPSVVDVARADPAAVRVRYADVRPAAWGDHLPGVLQRLPVTHVTTDGVVRPVVALTFDACGNGPPSSPSSGYDADVVRLLRAHRVPATLFVSARWVGRNAAVAVQLAADPLFELGNHGTRHVPLSVTGRARYGIPGTVDAADAVGEVWGSTIRISQLRGRRPTLFRPGTATYDDVGVAIARSLGQHPVGYTQLLDFGATASASVVARQLATLQPGGIALGHFNHPHGSTAEGLARALPRLLAAGWRFVRVSDVL